MNKELWRDIKEYEELYEISSWGRVRNKRTGDFLKNNIGKYPTVVLCKNKKQNTKRIHRLVAEAFLSKPQLEVNHKNGNKKDNRLNNLEWVTCKENIKHAWENGLQVHTKQQVDMGKSNAIKVLQYDLNGNLIKEWNSATEAGKKLGILQQSISNCRTGKTKTAGGYIWKYKEESRK